MMEEIQTRIESQYVQPKMLKQEQVAYQNYLKSLKDEETLWRLKS